VGPEDASICKGENATFNCGYFFNTQIVAIPQWKINGMMRFAMEEIDNDTNDLLQWIVDGNDTNTTRLLVGPVDERFVGRTTFQCQIPILPPVSSNTAVLIVIGKLSFVTVSVWKTYLLGTSKL